MKTITVKEAVEKVNAGQSLEGYTLDQESARQVNVVAFPKNWTARFLKIFKFELL